MSEAETAPKGKKDRSPSFPFIPLRVSVERLVAFEKHFGRHPTPADRAGAAWGLKSQSSQADQTLAALRSFGLVNYDGTGPKRLVSISEDGRRYLRAQQDAVKEATLKLAALRPRIIRKFWAVWGEDRPVDAVALDTLVLENGFSDNGARAFLKVYDDTVTYAKLSLADKTSSPDEDDGELEMETPETPSSPVRRMTPPPKGGLHAELGVAMRTAVFPLPEGDVSLTYPAILSEASLGLLRSQIDFTLKAMELAKQAATTLYPNAKVPGETDFEA